MLTNSTLYLWGKIPTFTFSILSKPLQQDIKQQIIINRASSISLYVPNFRGKQRKESNNRLGDKKANLKVSGWIGISPPRGELDWMQPTRELPKSKFDEEEEEEQEILKLLIEKATEGGLTMK